MTTLREIVAQVRFVPVSTNGDEVVYLAQVMGPNGELGIPIQKGEPGDTGAPGPSLQVQGEAADFTALPGLGNTSTDRGKAYWVGPRLYAWSGTQWFASPDLTGPLADVRIRDALDYNDDVVPKANQLLAWNGQKWAPFTPPAANFERATWQDAGSDGWQAVIWTHAAGDTNAIKWNAGNHVVTATVAGYYAINWAVHWDYIASIAGTPVANNNIRGSQLVRNGEGGAGWAGSAAGNNGGPGGGGSAVPGSVGQALIALDAGDTLEVWSYHNQGGNLRLNAAARGLRLNLAWLRPL